MNLKELPIEELPREKMLHGGVRILSDTELIAVLLSSGSEELSALELANRVLALEEGSLIELASYEPEEFMTIKGIGVAKACKLVAAMELGRRISVSSAKNRIKVNTPADMAALFMDEMRILNKEVFRIALFNIKNELIGKSEISIGSVSSASANPRDVFSAAIRKGAYAIVLVHNHPSGDPTPSKEDVFTTAKMIEAGKLMGVHILDHIIIGDACYCSLRENGELSFE